MVFSSCRRSTYCPGTGKLPLLVSVCCLQVSCWFVLQYQSLVASLWTTTDLVDRFKGGFSVDILNCLCSSDSKPTARIISVVTGQNNSSSALIEIVLRIPAEHGKIPKPVSRLVKLMKLVGSWCIYYMLSFHCWVMSQCHLAALPSHVHNSVIIVIIIIIITNAEFLKCMSNRFVAYIWVIRDVPSKSIAVAFFSLLVDIVISVSVRERTTTYIK